MAGLLAGDGKKNPHKLETRRVIFDRSQIRRVVYGECRRYSMIIGGGIRSVCEGSVDVLDRSAKVQDQIQRLAKLEITCLNLNTPACHGDGKTPFDINFNSIRNLNVEFDPKSVGSVSVGHGVHKHSANHSGIGDESVSSTANLGDIKKEWGLDSIAEAESADVEYLLIVKVLKVALQHGDMSSRRDYIGHAIRENKECCDAIGGHALITLFGKALVQLLFGGLPARLRRSGDCWQR